MTTHTKPLLLIDVDEVLNVWPHRLRPDGDWRVHTVENADGGTYMLHLNPIHGEWLNGLTDLYELAWGTSWWQVANERISPLLGLPIDMPTVPLPQPRTVPLWYSWKTPMVRDWAQGRALAWIDDDITTADAEALMSADVEDDMWLDGPAVSDALCVNIPLNIGLTWDHIVRLREWTDAQARLRP